MDSDEQLVEGGLVKKVLRGHGGDGVGAELASSLILHLHSVMSNLLGDAAKPPYCCSLWRKSVRRKQLNRSNMCSGLV